MTLAERIREGLTNPAGKTLPAAVLYDEVGSALFDAITALPEYGLTRADLRLLRRYSGDIAKLSGATRLIELGSGNGVKTRALLSAFPQGTHYVPIDVSRTALDRCVAELSGYPVDPVEAEFLPGLREALKGRGEAPVLVAFLGSNIGNFERGEIVPFFQSIRAGLKAGDGFLLGADLVKPADVLIPAYDDAVGVTAAFNRNLLARLNRDFGADFDLRQFEHETRWNASERRIEMHLRSRVAQCVRMFGLEIGFAEGETIWTESSHKFEVAELRAMGVSAGFAPVAEWTDEQWPFTELLFGAV